MVKLILKRTGSVLTYALTIFLFCLLYVDEIKIQENTKWWYPIVMAIFLTICITVVKKLEKE